MSQHSFLHRHTACPSSVESRGSDGLEKVEWERARVPNGNVAGAGRKQESVQVVEELNGQR